MRFNTRFQYCLISLTSQCALLASRKASQATTLARIAMRLEQQHRDFEFVDAQMKDRVIEFARHLQRPERRALRDQAVDIGRRGRFRRLDRNGRDPRRAVDVDIDKAVADAAVVDGALERRQRDALAVAVALRGGGEFLGALGDLGFQLAVRHDLVDQPPCDGALALDAFLDGAEEIGMVAAHLALVDHARQAAGARQHREQRHFRQRHGGGAVVGEDDVIGRERQFIAAAGRGAVDDGDEALPGILRGIFQAVAGLVGEFAEIDFVGVGRARQHADIGAGAEHAVLARAHHHRPSPRDARSAAAARRRRVRCRRRDRRN